MAETRKERLPNDGLLAVVTGASCMIGRPIVRLLLEAGYRVRVLSRRQSYPDPRVELIGEDILVRGSGIKYFCHLSNAGGVGLSDRRLIDETAPCHPRNKYEKTRLTAEKVGLPLVSVVIPTYNAGQFLRQAIESVLDQTYPRIELLVFDDGSQDNTREILRGYGNRFTWESQVNMGQAATLNKGWSMAGGEILSYLSADDALKPGAVAAAVAFLWENPDAVMVYGDYELIDVNGKLLRTVAVPEFDYDAMVGKIVVQPGPGVFFRRKAFARAGGWDPSLRQIPDYDFWLRLGAVGPFRRVPEVLAEYRVHGESQSFIEPTREKAEECVRVMEKFFSLDRLPDEVLTLKARAFASAHLFCARLHLRGGRYGEVFRHLGQAWRWRPGSVLSLQAVRLMGNGLLFRLWRKFGRVR